MSIATKNHMKDRWDRIRTVAAVIGVDKQLVHRNWARLQEPFLLKSTPTGTLESAILQHIPEAIACAKSLFTENQPRLFQPDDPPKPKSTTEALALAFWYLKKIDDIDLAEKAMAAAIHAHRKLSR